MLFYYKRSLSERNRMIKRPGFTLTFQKNKRFQEIWDINKICVDQRPYRKNHIIRIITESFRLFLALKIMQLEHDFNHGMVTLVILILT